MNLIWGGGGKARLSSGRDKWLLDLTTHINLAEEKK